MLKDKLKGFISGMIIMSLVFGGVTVFAANTTTKGNLVFRNIKIYIDGALFTPKDGNGNVVEPFIYNGSTYLPLKAISTAFGKDVTWDGNTSSVYIGKTGQNQPDAYLSDLQYTNYQEGDSNSDFWKINGKVTDYLKKDYTSGMLFYSRIGGTIKSWSGDYPYAIDDGSDDLASQSIAYPLNSQYKKLTGNILLPKSFNIAGPGQKDNANYYGTETATVYFYGDGGLIKSFKDVTTTMPFSFDINVSGVNSLEIKISTNNDNTYVALTDLALYK